MHHSSDEQIIQMVTEERLSCFDCNAFCNYIFDGARCNLMVFFALCVLRGGAKFSFIELSTRTYTGWHG